MFKRVRVAVEEMTGGEQTPWENSSLRGDFYFVAKVEKPPPKPAPKTVVKTKPSELTVQQLAARAYEAAERVNTISSYRLFVEQYPDTLYAKLAGEQIRKLETVVTPPAPSPEAVEASLDLKRVERQRIQIGLQGKGFNPGSPDGKFGHRTRGALQAWQRKSGHAATGYLTRDQAETILAQTPPVALLRPKCAELPGRHLGKNHAECWEKIANRPECYLWRTHYHSDQIMKWTGSCRSGVAEGHGMYSLSAGSEHSAYEGTGTLVGGKASGHWIDTWADGNRYEGELRAGKRHGRGVMKFSSGNRYEGEWEYNKAHGWGVYTTKNGKGYKGVFTRGCLWKNAGYWARIHTTKKACGFDVKESLIKVSLTRSTYGNETTDWHVPPVTDLRTKSIGARTPTKHALAKTITTRALHQLIIDSLPPVALIDVIGDEGDRTLPGALSLKGAGLIERDETKIKRRLEAALNKITLGDKARVLVFFCRGTECWLSYNAALRAVALGYENVYWYRGGITAWEDANLPTQKAVKAQW